jgi:hypothetical protein
MRWKSPLRWSFDWGRDTGDSAWGVVVPLWVPLTISFGATLAAWRLDALARRRAGLNLCPKCNYDRAGIAKDAVCPECGAKAL